jgi:tetratricopeptide (TPR) repeat protein
MSRALFALLLLLLVGCDDSLTSGPRSLETEDPEYRQGQIYQKQGETRKALECFLKVIDSHKGAAEAHLEAGRMYSDLNDPLPAIYHYNQYVRLKPNSEQKDIVKQMIKTAEKQFMAQLPGRPMEPDGMGNADLNERVRRLLAENEKLKRELADATRNQRLPDSGNKIAGTNADIATPSNPKTDPAVPAVTNSDKKGPKFKTYVVAKGDTLSSISQSAYGTRNRAADIMRANKLPSATSLQIGMKLDIPD